MKFGSLLVCGKEWSLRCSSCYSTLAIEAIEAIVAKVSKIALANSCGKVKW